MWTIGHDIIEVERIAKAIARHPKTFLKKIFTQKEQEYCLNYGDRASLHFAGRFAAKEAVVKALGTGINRQISWLDIQILPNPQGCPVVTISDRAQRHFPPLSIQISITHTRKLASAVAIVLVQP